MKCEEAAIAGLLPAIHAAHHHTVIVIDVIICQLIVKLLRSPLTQKSCTQFPPIPRATAAPCCYPRHRRHSHVATRKRLFVVIFAPCSTPPAPRRCNADRRLPRKSKQSRRAAAQRWRASCLPLLPTIVTPPSCVCHPSSFTVIIISVAV